MDEWQINGWMTKEWMNAKWTDEGQMNAWMATEWMDKDKWMVVDKSESMNNYINE